MSGLTTAGWDSLSANRKGPRRSSDGALPTAVYSAGRNGGSLKLPLPRTPLTSSGCSWRTGAWHTPAASEFTFRAWAVVVGVGITGEVVARIVLRLAVPTQGATSAGVLIAFGAGEQAA